MKHATKIAQKQRGATLIEVLIAILILSFGMLSLGVMMSFSVQMPKLSGYRATATNIAADHIERIRANPEEFLNGNYSSTLSYDAFFYTKSLNECAYPNCTAATLATMDIAATERAVRIALPAGGLLVNCGGVACGPNAIGNLWIVWQEPETSAALNSTGSDECPVAVTGTYTNPAPRCLYVRFKI